MRTCYNCGHENADTERLCHNCGADLWKHEGFRRSGLAAGLGDERVLWDNGRVQLTTEAVLIDMHTDAPDVVPLSTISDTEVRDDCLVLKIKDETEKYCSLDAPAELEALVRDHMFRPRMATTREDTGYTPAD